jgi:hypothetical protein
MPTEDQNHAHYSRRQPIGLPRVSAHDDSTILAYLEEHDPNILRFPIGPPEDVATQEARGLKLASASSA